MDAAFTPEQEARIREIVREMFPDIEEHIDSALAVSLRAVKVRMAPVVVRISPDKIAQVVWPGVEAILHDPTR